MGVAHCPALMISAIASGQGKTSTTAALARSAARRGLRVRVFKAGPDFIDPTLLARACGAPVYQLDLWMVGAALCRQLLFDAARVADLILIEGVMGLYDGTPSSADLAVQFGVPVAVVIDAAAMAQTFGALARGLRDTPGAPRLAGVIANRVDSAGHAQLLAVSLPPGLPLLGRLATVRSKLPERHLGLHEAGEIADLDARLDALSGAIDFDRFLDALAPCAFAEPDDMPICEPLLRGQRIGVARDAAFSFLYPANLDTLQALGAELCFFSPLHDAALPAVDSLYLPGGYPELHARRLAANQAMRAALRRHHEDGKPMLAECGGMMALMTTLVDAAGEHHRMAGILPGEASMQSRVQAIAPQAIDTDAGELRGHSFHYSRLTTSMQPAQFARNPLGGAGEAVYREGRLTASYLHHYFASNPRATAALFGA